MKIETTNIVDVRTGSTQVNKVYLGSNLVWQSFVGLLDLYPNAAAAYSLRRLRTNYSGSAIRVRRTDNTEQDIGFVNNELDTTSLLSFVGSGDGFVVTFYGQSSNLINSTQSTAASQGKIVNSGSLNTKNGKPCVLFNGTSNTYPLPSGTNDATIFSVGAIDVDDSTFFNLGGVLTSLGTATSVNNVIGVRGREGITSGAYVLGAQFLAATMYINTTDFYLNGTQESGSDTIRANFAGSYLGSRNLDYYLDGSFQEYVVYQSDESTDRSAIETNINDFYSIY